MFVACTSSFALQDVPSQLPEISEKQNQCFSFAMVEMVIYFIFQIILQCSELLLSAF